MAWAQDASPAATTPATSAEDLAKLKQNPVSGLRQLILVANVSPEVPGADDPLGIYSVQAVWPFALGDDWRLVSYAIVPVLDVPATPSRGSVSGLGNTLLNFYVSPMKPTGNLVWGIGPAVLLPTRSKRELGTDRYGLGPSGILFYAKDAWSAGVVLQNIWSLGGSGADEVNAFGAQYIFNYNLDDGWFLYSNETISADWTADGSDRWTVPVGAGVGRVFNIGRQPVSASFQVYSNVVNPDGNPDWGWNAQFAWLFP